MGNLQPLLALVGVVVGSVVWSPTVRFVGTALWGNALADPMPANIVRSKVGRVLAWLAVVWLSVFGAALAASTSIGALNGWQWFFIGILVVPFIWVTVFFVAWRKVRSS
jgi:hypothetical protein